MSPRRTIALCLAVLTPLVVGAQLHAADDLAAKIDALITAPEYKHSRWGILVVDGDTGKPVYAHNADQLFAPASVTKLFSTAAALVDLGGDYCFETPVYRRGEVVEGHLHGDLILVAKGDVTLGGRTDADGKMAFKNQDHIYTTATSTTVELPSTDPLAGLKDLAKQVEQAGIKQNGGYVRIDNRLFDQARGSGSGPDMLTPIVVNDNIIDVVITAAGKPGEPATAKRV